MIEIKQKPPVDAEVFSKVANLASLVTIGDGAVVSRTVIKKPTGTVTVFGFDAGEGLSEHTAPFDAMVYVLDGEVDITISGASYNLKTGDTIVMPAGEPHGMKAITKYKMLLIMIKNAEN
ncbi:MAG: cupin domain-containing protein [Candidatus Kapabacteria bacterium]|nr:cupin domain-containing protein [Candidatus Kapabacteria bacterium]